MNSLQRRKRAFMSIITRPLGFVRTVSGVPPLSLPYAMEGKADNYVIEGKSVQGKNLVNYPYAIGNSGTTNGIDYTVNADGSIVLNGTATSAIYLSFNIGSSLVKLTPGETYTLSGCPEGGGGSLYFMAIQSNPESGHTVSTTSKGSSFVAQKNSYRIYIFVAANMEVENLTFYPQLEKGSTVTEWQSPVPSPENPIEIKSVGVKTVNLFDADKFLDYGFIKQEDGSYYLKSTSDLSKYTAEQRRIFINNGYEGQMKITYEALYPTEASPNPCAMFYIYYTDGSRTTQVYTEIIYDEWHKIIFITPSDKQVDYVLMTYSSGRSTSFRNIMITQYIETDYEPYGKYKIPITNRGVNLLPFPYTTSPGISGGLTKPTTINGITYTPHEDGSITIDGTSTAAYSVYIWGDKTSLIPGLKVGDTITISKNPDDLSQHANVYFVCNYYDSEGTMRSGAMTSNAATTNTKVITEDWVGIGAYIHVPKEKTLNNLTIKPQIQIGSVASDYEPYRPPITTSIFLDEPLRGIGDYKDKIDFESGTLERKIISKSFDGTEAWKNYNNFIYFPITGIMASPDCLCTRLPNNITSQGIGDGTLYVRPVTDSLRIVVSNGSYTDVDEWKSLLAQWGESEMPFILVTQLINPITEQLTLPELPLFEGTNILSIEGDIQPDMTVVYKASVKEV